jgi:hypothetical protein
MTSKNKEFKLNATLSARKIGKSEKPGSIPEIQLN